MSRHDRPLGECLALIRTAYFDDPVRLRERAEEFRRMADDLTRTEAKETLLGFARDYERIARMAEDWLCKKGTLR